MAEIHKMMLLMVCGAIAAGCHSHHPASSTQPVAALNPNAGVVVHKPFIAISSRFGMTTAPSVLLQQHARTDSPIPLSEYSKQAVHSLSAFDLRPSLSAAQVAAKLGPAAQWADYSDPWIVYRLSRGRELWLHFSQPNDDRLLAADVIIPVEDGYTRKRVFSIDDSH